MKRQEREAAERRARLLEWLKRLGGEGATSTEAAHRFGVRRTVINRDFHYLQSRGDVRYATRQGGHPARAWWRPDGRSATEQR